MMSRKTRQAVKEVKYVPEPFSSNEEEEIEENEEIKEMVV